MEMKYHASGIKMSVYHRLNDGQAQLHALAGCEETYTVDPDPTDCSAEEWTTWLADLNLDTRQGEISELMINNANIR